MGLRLPRSWRDGLELTSRLGYAARAAVYLTIGVIAVLAAVDLTPRPAGAGDALELWATWPLGLVLISALAGCLLAFSGWRVLQAVFDADGHGTGPRAWAVRAGQAVSGLAYGALAVSALELLDGLEDIGEADETDSALRTVEARPFGSVILAALGLGLIAFGLFGIVEAVFRRIDAPRDLSPT